MIVDSAVYRGGTRLTVECDSHDYAELRRRAAEDDGFVWIGLHQPSQAELAEVADVFGLHRLAVEDAFKAHQRPKVESYDDSLFLILKTLWYVDADDAVETGEISLFVGHDFVITVRHGSGAQLQDARARLERSAELLTHGPSSVVYTVCDVVVDAYTEVVAFLEEDVDEVEESVFSPARTRDSVRIYTLKREIAEVRRAILPLREPMRRFSLGTVHGVSEEAAPYFRDVVDHLTQAAEIVDSLDGLLSTAFDAHLASISVQQNDDMRKISAGAAIVLLPTLIAGVYGMNFDTMPELHWSLGYPFALMLMAGSSGLLWWFFKRAGWL